MSAVKELIRAGVNETLEFGDYTLDQKAKLDGFDFQGNLYKVKTFAGITKLERDGMFVYESVPGTAVKDFAVVEKNAKTTKNANKSKKKSVKNMTQEQNLEKKVKSARVSNNDNI